MNNVQTMVKDGKLIITIDLAAKGSPSASGKSILIASTHGNAFIPDANGTLGLNFYRKK